MSNIGDLNNYRYYIPANTLCTSLPHRATTTIASSIIFVQNIYIETVVTCAQF